MFENLPQKCESRNGGGMLSSERVCGLAGQMSEQALKGWRWVTSGISWSLSECERMRLACEIKEIGRTMRTRQMVKRYSEELNQGHYDIAIVGHTHRPGEFGSWYYNSGSWTGLTNNFIRISPCGQVQVFDWWESRACIISDGGIN
jgi:UDP-2,3-diacylglucosamine pyrophosphatase LpxH